MGQGSYFLGFGLKMDKGVYIYKEEGGIGSSDRNQMVEINRYEVQIIKWRCFTDVRG